MSLSGGCSQPAIQEAVSTYRIIMARLHNYMARGVGGGGAREGRRGCRWRRRGRGWGEEGRQEVYRTQPSQRWGRAHLLRSTSSLAAPIIILKSYCPAGPPGGAGAAVGARTGGLDGHAVYL